MNWNKSLEYICNKCFCDCFNEKNYKLNKIKQWMLFYIGRKTYPFDSHKILNNLN